MNQFDAGSIVQQHRRRSNSVVYVGSNGETAQQQHRRHESGIDDLNATSTTFKLLHFGSIGIDQTLRTAAAVAAAVAATAADVGDVMPKQQQQQQVLPPPASPPSSSTADVVVTVGDSAAGGDGATPTSYDNEAFLVRMDK